MLRSLIVLLVLMGVAACTYQGQFTSGTAYLSRYAETRRAGGETVGPSDKGERVDAMIRAAASIEPELKLPARFGLARIVNGRLTAIPAAEGDLWKQAAERQGAFGEFVAISPLLAALSDPAPPDGAADPQGVVRTIRLGAARQHVDAVLIYEVGATSQRKPSAFALADLTIIGGAFLPTRELKADGRAEALLVDVRNGYPYGTASARADLEALHPSWGAQRRSAELREEAVLAVVTNLVPEAEAMFRKVMAAALERQRS